MKQSAVCEFICYVLEDVSMMYFCFMYSGTRRLGAYFVVGERESSKATGDCKMVMKFQEKHQDR